MFRIDLGRELKRVAPWTWKLASLNVENFPLPLIAGTQISLPLLSEVWTSSPQFGDIPSKIVHA